MSHPSSPHPAGRTLAKAVIALTAFVTLTTIHAREARAEAGGAKVLAPTQPAAAAPPALAPAPQLAPPPAPIDATTATPLAVRATPATPLTLTPSSSGVGIGYKLLALLMVGGGIAFYVHKKRSALRSPALESRIDILSRVGLGVRTELVVVEVQGTRLLIGMTPSAIQTLLVLDAHEAVAEAVDDEPARPNDIGARVSTLLAAVEPQPTFAPVKTAVRAKPRAVRLTTREAPANAKTNLAMREVAGQARGLLLSSDEGE